MLGPLGSAKPDPISFLRPAADPGKGRLKKLLSLSQWPHRLRKNAPKQQARRKKMYH
jgi:hypothetical protein